jgi:uncharacterized coiled-coil protein SlyX
LLGMGSDEMSAEIEQMIRDIHHESTLRLPHRRADDAALNLPDDTVLGYAADADAYGWRCEQRLIALQSTVAAQQAAITALTAAMTSAHGGVDSRNSTWSQMARFLDTLTQLAEVALWVIVVLSCLSLVFRF